jgi:hypothetical protein
MPGYSGTPLPQKLGIKAGYRACLINAPAEVGTKLKSALAKCEIVNDNAVDLDFVMVFTKSRTELENKIQQMTKSLSSAGMLWIGWPKKSSGVATDVNENVIRDIGLAAGLVDVKVCAVTEIWSGLKFVRRVKDGSK